MQYEDTKNNTYPFYLCLWYTSHMWRKLLLFQVLNNQKEILRITKVGYYTEQFKKKATIKFIPARQLKRHSRHGLHIDPMECHSTVHLQWLAHMHLLEQHSLKIDIEIVSPETTARNKSYMKTKRTTKIQKKVPNWSKERSIPNNFLPSRSNIRSFSAKKYIKKPIKKKKVHKECQEVKQ